MPARRITAVQIMIGLSMTGTASLPLSAQTVDAKVLRYGEHLSRECTSCHSREGADNGIPSILGMSADIFAETFKYYQSGTRTNPAMVSVAESLDEEQIQALAHYFASLPPNPPKKP
ncbi:MAG: hypothetical protein ABL901_06120 [Hyphomicrobiaceae bacterium]